MDEYACLSKARVLTFFNPESDPMGSGYHLLQSKIALGSGGFFGKGFLNGTQSKLGFVQSILQILFLVLMVRSLGLSESCCSCFYIFL